MIKRESEFGILLRHWVHANYKHLASGSIEIKDSRGKESISYTEIKSAQLDFAMAAKSDRGVLIRNQGGNGEADYTFLRNALGLVVIRYPGRFMIIDAETFILEKERNKRKSLTSDRAHEISIKTVKLKK